MMKKCLLLVVVALMFGVSANGQVTVPMPTFSGTQGTDGWYYMYDNDKTDGEVDPVELPYFHSGDDLANWWLAGGLGAWTDAPATDPVTWVGVYDATPWYTEETGTVIQMATDWWAGNPVEYAGIGFLVSGLDTGSTWYAKLDGNFRNWCQETPYMMSNLVCYINGTKTASFDIVESQSVEGEWTTLTNALLGEVSNGDLIFLTGGETVWSDDSVTEDGDSRVHYDQDTVSITFSTSPGAEGEGEGEGELSPPVTNGAPVAGMLGLGLVAAACALGGTIILKKK